MRFLVYDTETSGLVHDRLPIEHPSQPDLVQLAALLLDENAKELAAIHCIIKPQGWVIPDQAAKVHGITTALANEVGIPHLLAVAMFTNLRALADVQVAHNLSFDERVMSTAIHRTGKTPSHPGPMERACTKELATPVLNLPPTAKMVAAGFNKPKPPTLSECYLHLFGETLEGAHDAMVDTRACARVFFRLRNGPAVDTREEAAKRFPLPQDGAAT
jgi:DNA polymerase-3 subunit epsilon